MPAAKAALATVDATLVEVRHVTAGMTAVALLAVLALGPLAAQTATTPHVATVTVETGMTTVASGATGTDLVARTTVTAMRKPSLATVKRTASASVTAMVSVRTALTAMLRVSSYPRPSISRRSHNTRGA